jgi:hypothetical protein
VPRNSNAAKALCNCVHTKGVVNSIHIRSSVSTDCVCDCVFYVFLGYELHQLDDGTH